MSRNLTSGEELLAREVYQNSVDYTKVKIHDGGYIWFQPDDSGMTPNGEIYVTGTAYSTDYARASNGLKSFFIHEMCHVWQYQTGILNPILSALGEQLRNSFDYSKAYPYTLTKDKDLLDYGMEQQAAIVADYFQVLKRGLGFSRYNQNTEGLDEKKNLLRRVLTNFIKDPSKMK
jgi:hypothetical protein